LSLLCQERKSGSNYKIICARGAKYKFRR